jgi:hypothetical protein
VDWQQPQQSHTEVSMKKLILLAGIIAAVVGARKLFAKKEEETAQPAYPSNGYAPQAQ